LRLLLRYFITAAPLTSRLEMKDSKPGQFQPVGHHRPVPYGEQII
jgi:hypothetical protein